MRIEHIAIWTRDLERLKTFYETYFKMTAEPKYINQTKQFESYFLKYDSGTRLELMQIPNIIEIPKDKKEYLSGYCHLAISVGSKEEVDSLTARLNEDGFQVLDGPRHTGDGYYESRVLDCDGNQIEITV